MAKKLVAYFSAEGTTRKKAEIIAEVTVSYMKSNPKFHIPKMI